MNKQAALGMWDMQRQRFGMAVRAIEAIPAEKLNTTLVPGMRTPLELTVHMMAVNKGCAESLGSGEFTSETDADVLKRVTTRDQLVAYMKESWAAAQQAVDASTDAQLVAMVKTPWGSDFPGFVMLGIAADELIHHRGQLYTYVRLCGIQPPMLWDFENSAPEFRPKAQAMG